MKHPDKTTLDALRIDRSRAQTPAARGWWVGLAVLLLGLAGGVLWFATRVKVPVVRTAVAQESSSTAPRTLLNASGYVTARRDATVSSKITGKVIEVAIEEGMRVEAGQVLARLDAANLQASLHLAEAQAEALRQALEETRVRLEEARRELRRIAQLHQDRIASPADLDRAEAEVQSLEARLAKQAADVTVAKREIALWHQQIEDTVVRAPFAGIVTAKNAQPGEMISPMSAGGGFTRTGICTLVDMSSLEIEVDVSESYINRVEPGQRAEAKLDSYPEWVIPARVIAIIPTADRQKATVKVRVAFESLDPRILPEMGVKVAFQEEAGPAKGSEAQAPSPPRVSVPAAALRTEDGRDLVWVVRDGRVERRAVTVGESRNGQAFLLSGLRGGERVVIEGPPRLADGEAVSEASP